MKVTAEHLALIREAVEPLDTTERRERYRSGNFPRASLVQDIDKRYRWDLLNEADRAQSQARLTAEHPAPTLITTLYVADYSDAHIDTALRAIVQPLSADA